MAAVGFKLTLGARKLERKDFGGLGKSGAPHAHPSRPRDVADPFLVIYPETGHHMGKHDARPPPIFKTEVIDNELNPTWRTFNVWLDQVPGGATCASIVRD